MSREETPVIGLECSLDDVLNKKKNSSHSKTTNKKKFKVLYENYYKNEILDSVRNEISEKELELERLVFGGEDNIVEQLNISQKESEHLVKEGIDCEAGSDDEKIFSKKKSRVPVWKDDDDDKILVREKASTYIKCHRSVSNRGSEKYEDFAREKFLKITGAPAWADLEQKRRTASSEDESDDELLKKTGNFIVSSATLPKGVINIRKCQNLTEANSKNDVIKSVEFHPASRVALIAGLSGSAVLYQVDGKTNPQIQLIHFDRFPISTAHFTCDGNELIVGSREHGYYYTYDMMKGKMSRIPWEKGMEQSDVKRFQLSPDGKLMVIHGRFGNIHLISSKTKEWIGSLKMNGEVIATSFNSDGSKMYSHGGTGEVYVWDMRRRLCIHKFVDEGCITGTSLAVSPNDQYLAAGSDVGIVNIYETPSVQSSVEPQPLKVLTNLTTEVTNLKFNCTSEILAMASSHKNDAIKLVHFPSLTVFSNFPSQEKRFRYISSLDFSLNSGYLLFGNNTGKAYLYRLRHYGNY